MVDGGCGSLLKSAFWIRNGDDRAEANRLLQCKKESHERNANMLNSEKTVAIKGV